MTYKALGAILRPFSRISGSMIYTPTVFAHVQTDGSYRDHRARIAVLIKRADEKTLFSDLQTIHANNSTETEWASIAYGLRFALDHGEIAIGIENDNLGVIHGLMNPANPLKQEYARYYRNEIQTLADETRWTGIRWIPREANRADDLFHQQNVTPFNRTRPFVR